MKFLLALVVFSLVFISCQKDIELDGEIVLSEPVLFIECILYPGENPKVYMSNSEPFFNEKVTPQETFVRTAEVELSDETNTYLLTPDSTFDKFRCRWLPYYTTEIEISHGSTYQLSILEGGQIYSSETTINQAQVNLNDVEYTPEFFDVYGGHDGIIMKFTDAPDEENFYRFQMNRMMDKSRMHAHVLEVVQSDCTDLGEKFLTVDLGRSIFSDASNDGRDMQFNAEVSFEYLQGDTAIVYLQSLDRKSAAFFQDLDEQLQSILNPFVEPTFIHSTIEGTLGVFGSAVRSDPVLFIYPQDNP
jgi:hypothetical protein